MAEKWYDLIFSYWKNDIYSHRDILIKMKKEGMSEQDAFVNQFQRSDFC